MHEDCKFFTPTPYGPGCEVTRQFIRTGDMIACVACPNYRKLETEEEVETENLTVEKVAIVARLSDGSVRQLRLTESQEAKVLGFAAAIANPIEWYHRKLKGVGIV